MPVARARDDGAADLAVLPQVDPGVGDLVRHALVEDVRLFGIVQGDVGDSVVLAIVDAQLGSSWPAAALGRTYRRRGGIARGRRGKSATRSEEHTSELQSLMRTSY